MSDMWIVAAAATFLGVPVFVLGVRGLRTWKLKRSVHLTKHARERMAQRGVTERQLMRVIARPERQKFDRSEDSVRLERTFPEGTLRVWVVAPWPAQGEIVVKSTAWQYVATLKVPTDRVGLVIGRNGRTINEISAISDARISVSKANGTVTIKAGDRRAVETARERIESIASRRRAA